MAFWGGDISGSHIPPWKFLETVTAAYGVEHSWVRLLSSSSAGPFGHGGPDVALRLNVVARCPGVMSGGCRRRPCGEHRSVLLDAQR